MSKLYDFQNLKSTFKEHYTTSQVELIIPSTILKAKYNIHNPLIRKTYKVQGGMGYYGNYVNIFNKEVEYLKILSGLPHFPKLVFIDYKNCAIYTEYAGVIIINDVVPIDWKKQLKEIIKTLNEKGIYQNDFYINNLLVYNGNLTLIDFGWADSKINYPFFNLTNELIEESSNIIEIFNYFSGSKNRDFYDKELEYKTASFKEELELSNINKLRPAELHTIIIWDIKDKPKADEYFQNKLPKTIKLVSGEVIEVDKDLQNQIAVELYNNLADNRVRGGTIYLALLEDSNAIYQKSKATACIQVLNINMQKIKNELRNLLGGSNGAYFKAHSSYNMEESKLVLDLFNKKELLPDRKIFKTLEDFFNTLNTHPTLKYIVQRSHKDIENMDNYRDGSDIDILVNDYYLFKAITDAESNNKIYMRENDNGFYIQNNVLIGDIKLAIDVRYIGDNYNNSKWQFDMLNTRILIDILAAKVYIPNQEHEFYSLIFNLLVQKHGRNNSKHYSRLNELMDILKLKVHNEETIEQYLNDINRGWTELYNFLLKYNYTSIEKPKDINVGYYTEPFSKLINNK